MCIRQELLPHNFTDLDGVNGFVLLQWIKILQRIKTLKLSMSAELSSMSQELTSDAT